MKKIFLTLAIVSSLALSVQARDRYERTDASLPQAAKELLKNFKAKVSLVKIDKSLGFIDDFEVTLTDGTEVTFDAKGNLDSVDVPASKAVPATIVPEKITSYVKSNYKNAKIVTLDKETYGYDVELNNGIEIKFDKKGNFKRYD